MTRFLQDIGVDAAIFGVVALACGIGACGLYAVLAVLGASA